MSGNNTTEAEQGTFTAVILPTFYLLLSIYVIIVNLVELLIITRIKTSSSTVFIASLAMTDLTMGIFAILPSSVSFLLKSNSSSLFFLGDILCDITGVISNTSLFASLLSVVCITLNRYIALAVPLHYNKISTNQAAYMMTAIVWFISLLRSLVPYFKLQRYQFNPNVGMCTYYTNIFGDREIYYYPLLQVIPYSVCFVFLIFCPLHMTALLAKRQKQSANMRSSLRKSDDNGGARGAFSKLRNGSLRKPNLHRSKSKAKQNEQEATTTTLLVVLGFVVCYSVNYFFICYYFAYLVLDKWPFGIPDTVYNVLETLWMMGINLNSIFNPIIYLFRNTAFKTELMKMKHAILLFCKCSTDPGMHTVIKGTSSGSASYKS
ncbi:hypothetical protein ACHWQZ_G018456 [Mnemiopsis leidyi]